MSSESDMKFFITVAQRSTLSEAALELGLTASAVSRRITRIEDRLGVRLLNRTTRRVGLTSEGEAYLKASMDIVDQIVTAEESISAARGAPQGLLRINATFQFGREHIAPALSTFATRYPGVQTQLVLTDAPANIVEEGFDLQIRFGEPTATSHVMALLLRNRRILVAAPSYLEKHPPLKRISDLAQHNCVVLRQEHSSYDVWRFGKDGDFRVTGRLSTNDGQVAVGWILNGHGIMQRSEWDIARHVKAGRLKVVLPRYGMRADVFAVYPERLNLSAKVRVFIDILKEGLKERTEELQMP
ncbi:HTH-type transcriptional regulator DmlR (plasmid) [Antarctobacter heliothermus]|uniref:HTH-type transcriptional regulator DmlR n=1 Tax=Antarctobacter heliothermus TaxID=74033 RepID=A0A222EAG3_9RHOB|nr:LysR family transcriptional regulator [Antarctobacter heliothermus]ASP23195.1 HTH-type transcriptional regulator DmlR [Antarctobacter heliothermus]